MAAASHKTAIDASLEPGKQAIKNCCDAVYTSTVVPKQLATAVKFRAGGSDPLDECIVYATKDGKAWHYISMGLTNLYRDPVVENTEDNSGFGSELTFRLKRGDETEAPAWPFALMQRLAKHVFGSGNALTVDDRFPCYASIAPDDVAPTSALTSILFTRDPELKSTSSLHGKIAFLQMVPVTTLECDASSRWNSRGIITNLLAKTNPHHICDLARTCTIATGGAAVKKLIDDGAAKDGSSSSSHNCARGVALSWYHVERSAGESKAQASSEQQMVLDIGAAAVQELLHTLPGRLPFQRSFELYTPQVQVLFVPARETDVKQETKSKVPTGPHFAVAETTLIVALTKSLTTRFLADLSAIHVGSYSWPELKNFRMHVVPSSITSATDGKELTRVGNVPKLPAKAADAAAVTATWPTSYTHPSLCDTPPMSVDAAQASAWTAPSATAARRKQAAFSKAAAKKAASSSSSSAAAAAADEEEDNDIEDVDGEWIGEGGASADEPLVMPDMKEFTEKDINDDDVAAFNSGDGGKAGGGGGKKRKQPAAAAAAGGKNKSAPKKGGGGGNGPPRGGKGGKGGNSGGRGGGGGGGGGQQKKRK